MRRIFLGLAALLVSAMPANAAWLYYACPSDGIASQFPTAPKPETAKFTLPRHKAALVARTYTATDDNIVYRILVADYTDRALDGASILEEAIFEHINSHDDVYRDGTMVENDTARVEPAPRGATYGRRLTIDLPKGGGRNITTFYFREGKLYEQSITILPANGDYTTPSSSRFIESTLFNLTNLKDESGGTYKTIEGCGTAIPAFTYR